jgi:AcrR family transcriptional regulator
VATFGTERSSTARDTARVEWEYVPTSIKAAVDRALNRQQREALDEVEEILDAALRVAVRVAPGDPKVADIVAEAGTSNQTFYRYFAGKDELMHAVMERGIVRTRSYLDHQMAKHSDPAGQVTAWVEGLLAQVIRPHVASQSAAITRLAHGGIAVFSGTGVDDLLGQLLEAPLAAVGRPHPDLDARAIQDATLGLLRRHVGPATVPSEREQRHLIEFCVAVLQDTPADS